MKTKIHTVLLFPLFFLIVFQIHAQDNIVFNAIGQTNVSVGDQFIVQFTINTQGNNFSGPDFEDFRVLTGPNTSTSSSFSNINGRMTQSIKITYSYYLRATKEGEFIIQPAKIKVNGKEYKSNSLTITVSKQKSTSQTQSQPTIQNPTSENQQVSSELNETDVFIKAFVDNQNPYVGEQVILTYKIYTKVNISNITSEKEPNFTGLWMKNLIEQGKQLNQSQEFINDNEYITVEIRKFAIFPQKSGEINISPLELQCIAQVRNLNSQRKRSNSIFDSFFDDPFFSGYQNIQKFLASNSVKINVKPLPQKEKPTNYGGTVGNYSVKSEIDNTLVKTNDAITLKYTVSGQGNIELIDRLNISFPTDFEVYDPKIIDNINISKNGVGGSRTFEYIIIPRNPGQFTIEAFQFSFFNPTTRTYETEISKNFTIQVEKSDNYQSTTTFSLTNQEDIQYIGLDIRHIKTKTEKLTPIAYFFYGSFKFILWFIIPIILFLSLIILWKKRVKKISDQSLMRHKKATKIARKNLKKANQFLETTMAEAFYNEISRALWGYLADKFNIPLAQLSKQSVKNALSGKKVKDSNIDQFIECLNHCDFARFAPGDQSYNMNNIYNEALDIISKIERELK